MKILLVSQCFFPEAFRVNDFCKRLVDDGNEVTVLTGFPNYPGGEIFDGYVQKQNSIETIFGAEVHRARVSPRHRGWINRFLNYESFSRNANEIVTQSLDGPFDLIFCWQTSPVSQLSPAIKASKKFGAPLIAYCCDVWPESLKAGGISDGVIFKMVARYSKKMYSGCTHIINASPSFLDYHHRINQIPLERMSWLIQFVDDFSNNGDGLQKKPNGNIDILFAGNIGAIQMIDQAIEAVKIANISNLHLHIVGTGIELNKCEEKVKELNIGSNVHFYGLKRKEEIPDFYRKCDACLLPLSNKTQIGLTLPSKLTEYLAAGKPILGYISGDARELIQKEHFGLVAEPDNPVGLAACFTEFSKTPEMYYEWGRKAREYFVHHGTLDIWIREFYQIAKKTKESWGNGK